MKSTGSYRSESVKKSICAHHARGADLVVRSMKRNSLLMNEKGAVAVDDVALNERSTKKIRLSDAGSDLLAIMRAKVISNPATGSRMNKMRCTPDAQDHDANRAIVRAKRSLKNSSSTRVKWIGLDAGYLAKSRDLNDAKKLMKL
jgi:hypothetical protein